MAFEYKFGKKKSDASEPVVSQERLEEIRKKAVEELTKQLKEKDEMILHDCERICGLEQQIEMLQCLIETKDKVIVNLNKRVELQNNLNDLIKKMQENREMNEIKIVDTKEYDSMKAKAESFDKLIDIVCHDGVKFHQEWNKQDIRKCVKGGNVKVGEIIGEWHGEIEFCGDDGQKEFGEFVKAMVEGLDGEQRLKIGVEE